MNNVLSRIIEQYEAGMLTRRQLVSRLSGVIAVAATATNGDTGTLSGGTFRAIALNHIALRVADVERSRDFYMQHLGLEVARESLPHNCFLNCGPNFVALFRSDEAGMHHYCYSIAEFDPQRAAAKLRAAGLVPSLQGNRIYFQDPDHLTVQLAAENHQASES